MAQLVARFPCKEEVIGSIPVASIFFFLFLVVYSAVRNNITSFSFTNRIGSPIIWCILFECFLVFAIILCANLFLAFAQRIFPHS